MMNLASEQLRRIDAAVAECMGYVWVATTYGKIRMLVPPEHEFVGFWPNAKGDEPLASDWNKYTPRFSKDATANAILWDWLISNGWYVALKYLNSELAQVHQAAVFRFKPTVVYSEDERDNRYLALCLAFLRATGVDTDALLADGDTADSTIE